MKIGNKYDKMLTFIHLSGSDMDIRHHILYTFLNFCNASLFKKSAFVTSLNLF